MKLTMELRRRVLIAVAIAGVLLLAACSSDDSSAESDTGSTIETATSADGAGDEGSSDPSVASGDDDEVVEAPDTSLVEERVAHPISSEELLEEMDLIADVVGGEAAPGEPPLNWVVDEYLMVCPQELLTISAVQQQEWLIPNLPVTRYVMIFETLAAATEFSDRFATSEVGCEATSETTITTSVARIDSVAAVELGGLSGTQLDVTTEVQLVDSDQPPQSAESIHIALQHENAVIVLAGLRNYEDLVGYPVYEPLVADALAALDSLSP